MSAFNFRNRRIETNFEIKLRLQKNSTGQVLDGEIASTVINVSKSGACLILSELFLDRIHLFFSTLKQKSHTLILDLSQQNTGDEAIIHAKSIWMDRYPHDADPTFVMGIQFLEKQSSLYTHLKKSPNMMAS
jgi:hypothetical protein